MSTVEIQLVRKYRQITEEGKTQILGYIDFMFASRNSAQPQKADSPAPVMLGEITEQA